MSLNDLPDVTFASKDINQILADMVSGYEQAYFAQTGEIKKLYPGDPIRIFLYTQALRELQLRHLIDDAAKQNLLKYSRDGNLDNIGALNDVPRLEEKFSTVTEKFTLSAPQSTVQTIPAGTRASPGNQIYFATIEDHNVPAGATEIFVTMQCTESGEIGNGFTPGQINILVDPLPWISGVTNTTESSGGTAAEENEPYRERIRLSPESFSVAGPEGAYEFFAKSANPGIIDVVVYSPSDGVVEIRPLMTGGTLPDQSVLDAVLAACNAKTVRPLTDRVNVLAPAEVAYNIDVQYWIGRENEEDQLSIQSSVEAAVSAYVLWQRSRLGRDINPTELIYLMRLAGAKRVVVTSPTFTVVARTGFAVAGTINIVYGGVEDE
ncbi:baseplate assembly protein [Paenibacillus naphthalenovorans]|uniref:baseplate assembly protein n=1 Tax=Paenibacillus naphthalenovorans TaxID=162209 RepID=UPI003D26779C